MSKEKKLRKVKPLRKPFTTIKETQQKPLHTTRWILRVNSIRAKQNTMKPVKLLRITMQPGRIRRNTVTKTARL